MVSLSQRGYCFRRVKQICLLDPAKRGRIVPGFRGISPHADVQLLRDESGSERQFLRPPQAVGANHFRPTTDPRRRQKNPALADHKKARWFQAR